MTDPTNVDVDPRAELFSGLMRMRFGVTDINREDHDELLRVASVLEQDLRALDHVGLAYAKRDLRAREGSQHTYDYDPSAWNSK